MQRYIVAFIAMVSVSSCASIRGIEAVSLADIIASPASFDGKRVAVSGYIEYGFENCVLWSDKKSVSAVPNGKAVWYWPRNKSCYGPESFSPRKGSGVVTGIVRANDAGHLGMFPFSISEASFKLTSNGI